MVAGLWTACALVVGLAHRPEAAAPEAVPGRGWLVFEDGLSLFRAPDLLARVWFWGLYVGSGKQ